MKPSLWSRFIQWCGYVFDLISNFVSRNFGSNFGLKIFAIILSVAIIHLISERTGIEKEFTVPVKIIMDTKNTALSSYSPSEVKVSLKGTLEDLNVVDASLLSAEIVVRNEYSSGEHLITKLYSKDIRNHGKLRIEDITPNKIDIVFDKEASYRIPVALPKLEGVPLRGGKASVKFVSGSDVVIRGSELKLARLTEGGFGLSTRSIDVTDRSNSFEREIEIIVPPDLEVKSIAPKTLKVFVEIELPHVETPVAIPAESNDAEQTLAEQKEESGDGAQVNTDVQDKLVQEEIAEPKAE